jgi:hypothetical protein
MRFSNAFLVLVLFGLLVFSASAFAWGSPRGFGSGYGLNQRYTPPAIGPGTNSNSLPQAAQARVSLNVNVTGGENPKNAVGTLYAQVGLGPGETRGFATTNNGKLVFSNLKPNQYYFLRLTAKGRTAVHAFVYVGKSNTTITKFV